MEHIDFVIPWVDGADPAWLEQFLVYRQRHSPTILATTPEAQDNARNDATREIDDSSEERYRDWGIVRYLLRSIDKFTPWVNRIHFITWGHLPAWLDTSHPKLNIVNHKDFIPHQYLPTFNSCTIEANMHRIKGLADKFVYFNDDILLCRPIPSERFFKGGLPRDMARLNVIRDERVDHNRLECVRIINKRHKRKGTIIRNASKWFNPRYPLVDMTKTISLLPWSFFPGFREFHAPQPFLKKTFETLWAEEYNELNTSSHDNFRTLTCIPQWLMRYEQLVTAQFSPINMQDMGLTKLADDNAKQIAEMILSGKYAALCINDNNEIKNHRHVGESLTKALEMLLPDKSAYEL